MKNLKKQILYIDLNTTLMHVPSEVILFNKGKGLDKETSLFTESLPLYGAIEAFKKLSQTYDTYIVSNTGDAPFFHLNDRQSWVKAHFGKKAASRLVICPDKRILKGDFFIVGCQSGHMSWNGSLIILGSNAYPDWGSIVRYLMPQPKPTSYDHIEEILTLELPLRTDTYRHVITNKDQPEYEEIVDFYTNIMDRKLEEIKAGKYGHLYKEGMYEPESGWYEDTQRLTFDFGDFDVAVELTDLCIDPEGSFNEVLTYINCKVESSDDEVPDYIKALEFESECEYECFEETLATLFREVGKCKERYLQKH